jgi:hypothetical protein
MHAHFLLCMYMQKQARVKFRGRTPPTFIVTIVTFITMTITAHVPPGTRDITLPRGMGKSSRLWCVIVLCSPWTPVCMYVRTEYKDLAGLGPGRRRIERERLSIRCCYTSLLL